MNNANIYNTQRGVQISPPQNTLGSNQNFRGSRDDRKPAFTAEDFESFYTDLEWMFYDLRIALNDMFGDASNQL